MGLKDCYLNPFQDSVVFHIEITHFICNENFPLNTTCLKNHEKNLEIGS